MIHRDEIIKPDQAQLSTQYHQSSLFMSAQAASTEYDNINYCESFLELQP